MHESYKRTYRHLPTGKDKKGSNERRKRTLPSGRQVSRPGFACVLPFATHGPAQAVNVCRNVSSGLSGNTFALQSTSHTAGATHGSSLGFLGPAYRRARTHGRQEAPRAVTRQGKGREPASGFCLLSPGQTALHLLHQEHSRAARKNQCQYFDRQTSENAGSEPGRG